MRAKALPFIKVDDKHNEALVEIGKYNDPQVRFATKLLRDLEVEPIPSVLDVRDFVEAVVLAMVLGAISEDGEIQSINKWLAAGRIEFESGIVLNPPLLVLLISAAAEKAKMPKRRSLTKVVATIQVVYEQVMKIINKEVDDDN